MWATASKIIRVRLHKPFGVHILPKLELNANQGTIVLNVCPIGFWSCFEDHNKVLTLSLKGDFEVGLLNNIKTVKTLTILIGKLNTCYISMSLCGSEVQLKYKSYMLQLKYKSSLKSLMCSGVGL